MGLLSKWSLYMYSNLVYLCSCPVSSTIIAPSNYFRNLGLITLTMRILVQIIWRQFMATTYHSSFYCPFWHFWNVPSNHFGNLAWIASTTLVPVQNIWRQFIGTAVPLLMVLTFFQKKTRQVRSANYFYWIFFILLILVFPVIHVSSIQDIFCVVLNCWHDTKTRGMPARNFDFFDFFWNALLILLWVSLRSLYYFLEKNQLDCGYFFSRRSNTNLVSVIIRSIFLMCKICARFGTFSVADFSL